MQLVFLTCSHFFYNGRANLEKTEGFFLAEIPFFIEFRLETPKWTNQIWLKLLSMMKKKPI